MTAATTQGLKLNFLAGWAHHASTRRHVAAAIDWHALLTACSLREAEEALVCPLHGYADANAYYRACTPEIEAIATPLLGIHAEDDPVIGLSSVPLEGGAEAAAAASAQAAAAAKGAFIKMKT